MATQVTNYQCPACTGPLKFSGGSGRLECEHCGAAYDVSEMEARFAEKEQAAVNASAAEDKTDWNFTLAGGAWSEEEAAHMRAYMCPSCSAELVCDDTTAATSCPYCGNPTVVPGQFAGMLRPDYVVPFRLDKKAAIAALGKHYKGKKFLPKSFTQGNRIEEIKGIYVPFWLFDATADAEMELKGTKTHSHRRGNEEITVTEYYGIRRRGGIAFEKIPVDGSSKMPDAHMDAIEPYDYRELKAFSSAYLPGFLADKYDVDAAACGERANARITASAQDALTGTVQGYSGLVTEHSYVGIARGNIKYALLPVWMLSTKWNGENYLFAMNGQTGKLIGDLPVDRGLFWSWFFRISLPLMAVLGIVLFGLMGGAV